MAYYQEEPWGQFPAYERSGIIASTLANVWRGKNQAAFKVEDFIPSRLLGKASKGQSLSEMRNAIRLLASQHEAREEVAREKEKKRSNQPRRVVNPHGKKGPEIA